VHCLCYPQPTVYLKILNPTTYIVVLNLIWTLRLYITCLLLVLRRFWSCTAKRQRRQRKLQTWTLQLLKLRRRSQGNVVPGLFLRVMHHHAVALLPARPRRALARKSPQFPLLCCFHQLHQHHCRQHLGYLPVLHLQQDQVSVWKQATDPPQLKKLHWQVKEVRSSAG